MIENIFKKKYAECMIARVETTDGSKGQAVGLALVSLPGAFTDLVFFEFADLKYFFTYSTWLGAPGLYVSLRNGHETDDSWKTCTSSRSTGPKGLERGYLANWG